MVGGEEEEEGGVTMTTALPLPLVVLVVGKEDLFVTETCFATVSRRSRGEGVSTVMLTVEHDYRATRKAAAAASSPSRIVIYTAPQQHDHRHHRHHHHSTTRNTPSLSSIFSTRLITRKHRGQSSDG